MEAITIEEGRALMRSMNVSVVENKHLPMESKQVRFPRSKKKRVRKKWSKDRRNWRMVYEDTMYLFRIPSMSLPFSYSAGPFTTRIVVPPPAYARLKKAGLA